MQGVMSVDVVSAADAKADLTKSSFTVDDLAQIAGIPRSYAVTDCTLFDEGCQTVMKQPHVVLQVGTRTSAIPVLPVRKIFTAVDGR